MTTTNLEMAETFYTKQVESEQIKLEASKTALEAYTKLLRFAIDEKHWDIVNDIGSKISREAISIEGFEAEIKNHNLQLDRIADQLFDEAHPGHESK